MESLSVELLTQKWEACELAAKNYDTNDASPIDACEYLACLSDFYAQLEKSKPDDAVLYYFPDSKGIYENLCSSASELLHIVTEGGQITTQYYVLRRKTGEGVRNWEILQKNLLRFELNQIYYSYRILIFVIVVLIFVALVLLVMWLATSKSRNENKIFTDWMIKAQEAERERISNELHDTVCQDLRVLQFRLEDNESVSLCKKIATDVRNTCYALTPSDLNEGILEALISLCALVREASGLNIILSIQEDIKNNPAFKTFSKDKNLNIYRIVQEILTNAEKHAGAESISVLIRSHDEDDFKIIVSDDGKGFDLKTALKKKNHFGLKNLQTRVETLHGEIAFNSAEGEGTQISVIVPYA